MKTRIVRFSKNVNFVMSEKTREKMMESCLYLEKTQGEWLREAVDEKLAREAQGEPNRRFS